MIDTGVLFETVYTDLKRIAQRRLRGLPAGGTLHATVLVHEVYLRFLAKRVKECQGPPSQLDSSGRHARDLPQWPSRGAFFAACSEAMRRIIIDHHRRKVAQKRGGLFRRLPVEWVHFTSESNEYDLLEIEEALQAFAAEYPLKAEIVKLRFYCGMTMPEAAAALEISVATVERHWRFARAWMAEFLQKTPGS
jgi:RNA polymerase sigma factor (sigma-70 family)